jgi:hypothetical protein
VPDFTYAWQSGPPFLSMTAIMRDILTNNKISHQRVLQKDIEGRTLRTLSHAVAATLLYSVARRHTEEPNYLSDILFILRQLLALGADLHARDKYGATPFDYLCNGIHHGVYTEEERNYNRERVYNLVVRQWFEELHSHGIDLHAYAREEERLHQGGVLIDFYRIRVGLVRRVRFFYGTSTNELSLSVGDELVDIQIAIEQQIPGCWPEYDDTDDRYVVKDPVPFAGWSLHFKPPEETEQDAPESTGIQLHHTV